MLRLRCASQCYDWGKVGKQSMVYQLQVASLRSPDDFYPTFPYAELWMGTHPSGPSKIWSDKNEEDNEGSNNPDLSSYIAANPETLGKPCLHRFGRQLPFLFKVLSVGKALSIQAHPSKSLAVQLHAEQPDVYRDDNHKPEMAIALTDFRVLLGFRPLAQISAFVKEIPELQSLINVEIAMEVKNAKAQIKDMYSCLMRSPPEKVHEAIIGLTERFIEAKRQICDPPFSLPGLDPKEVDFPGLVDLFLQLTRDFPGDIGCLSVFFFNYLKLKPGEAIFLTAGTPHAYLSGDCIECMANSDNVIRAGLTPKFKDVDRLLSMLNYAPYEANELRYASKLQSTPCGVVMESFVPPVPDFAVDAVCFVEDSQAFSLPPVKTASIIIFVWGQGTLLYSDPKSKTLTETKFRRGFVFYASADVAINIIADANERLQAFRAYVNKT